jgi:acyl CoA:acetate/3-ketoacid CoA transferase alpha subunit
MPQFVKKSPMAFIRQLSDKSTEEISAALNGVGFGTEDIANTIAAEQVRATYGLATVLARVCEELQTANQMKSTEISRRRGDGN